MLTEHKISVTSSPPERLIITWQLKKVSDRPKPKTADTSTCFELAPRAWRMETLPVAWQNIFAVSPPYMHPVCLLHALAGTGVI
jgi:hypothetical protein